MATKVGIIGSGIVGQVLANGFAEHGYEVMIGTNNPAKYSDLRQKTGGKVEIGSFEATARFGETLVLATKGSVAVDVIKGVGVANLRGKTIIDTTNPIADAPPVNGVLRFFTTLDESLMERLQRAAPEGNFVKAFSCVGNAFMVNPDFDGTKPSMFICGNNASARAEVGAILKQFGHEVEDMGSVEAARAIEPLCMLWCIPGFLHNSWTHSFRLLRK